MITGTTRFNLSRDSRPADRRVMMAMYAVPAGTMVILDFGGRSLTSIETVDQLAQYVDSHHLDIQGEPGAVEVWVEALHERRRSA